MPRIIVTADDSDQRVLHSERVTTADFETDHFRAQLAERVAWAVEDAASGAAAPPAVGVCAIGVLPVVPDGGCGTARPVASTLANCCVAAAPPGCAAVCGATCCGAAGCGSTGCWVAGCGAAGCGATG